MGDNDSGSHRVDGSFLYPLYGIFLPKGDIALKRTETIYRTKHQRQRIKDWLGHRLKYALGQRVRVGRVYAACVGTDSDSRRGQCETLYYDAQSGTLVAYEQRKELFLLCSGDMAVYQNVLYAEEVGICLGHKEELFRYIMDSLKQPAAADEGAVFAVLRNRYHQVPERFLRLLARCYLSLDRGIANQPRCAV